MAAITATEARKTFFGLIQQVNDDHIAVEVVSQHGTAAPTGRAIRSPVSANQSRSSTSFRRVVTPHRRHEPPRLLRQDDHIVILQAREHY